MQRGNGGESIRGGRPRLGLIGRSVSDFLPVCDGNEGFDASSSQRAHVGGVKVYSGAKLATGGTAPFSPFLSLAPPPSIEEIKLMTSTSISCEDATSTPKFDALSGGRFGIPRPSTPTGQLDASEDISGSPSKRQRRNNGTSATVSDQVPRLIPRSSPPFAPMGIDGQQHRASECQMNRTQPRSESMLRSFSVPVPTQVEFDRQTRMMTWGSTARYQDNGSVWAAGWPTIGVTSPESRSASPTSASFPTPTIAAPSSPAPRVNMPRRKSSEVVSTRATLSDQAPASAAPRSALSSLTESQVPQYTVTHPSSPLGITTGLELVIEKNCTLADQCCDHGDCLSHGDSLSAPALSPPRRTHSRSSSGYPSESTEDEGARTPRALSPSQSFGSSLGRQDSSGTARLLTFDDADDGKTTTSHGWGWSGFIHPDHM